MYNKIKILIASPDEEYVQYFIQYVRQSEFNTQLILQSFTQFDKFTQVLEQANDSTLLFISSSWCSQLDHSSMRLPVVLMSETPFLMEDSPYPYIFKYQPLHQVITQLIKHVHQTTSNENGLVNHEQAKVISVYSSVGGCGKTTVAINLVHQLAKFRKKVMYLNLEMISSAAMIFSQPDQNEFSKLVYYVKNKPEELQEKLVSAIQYDDRLQCHYIQPSLQFKDVLDLTESNIQVLIQTMVEMKQYDVIVIDLDSSLDERFYGVFQACDEIIWLLSDDLQCKIKTRRLLHELKATVGTEDDSSQHKIKFTINKYTGTLTNSFETDEMKLFGYLPYIPNWKSINEGKQLTSSDVFHHHIIQLYQNLTGEKFAIEGMTVG